MVYMNILIIDNHTKNIRELLTMLKDYNVSIVKKELFTLEKSKSFDVIIISGGSGVHSVKNHPEDYVNEIELVRTFDKKIIGICLGCEIIACAFNCNLSDSLTPHIGTTVLTYKNNCIVVYEHHRFVITDVSPEISIIGTSPHGIEMIQHKNKPIYGLQFHPEICVDKNKGRKIFFEFLQK
jgi:anthranilate/para-aminobenzoate synthase component II